MAERSLYEKYGGASTVESLVKTFYCKVLASPSLSPYFGGVDTEGLKRHQTRFLSQVLGGPQNYSGRTLASAHRCLNVSEAAFDEVAVLLKQTLEEGGVEAADIATIMGIVASTKDDIVAAQAPLHAPLSAVAGESARLSMERSTPDS